MHMSITVLRFFLGVWFLPTLAHADENWLRAINQPGVIILMRHAQTYPGFGDPPGFQMDDCKTQRNLSQQGIAQARRLGRWLEQHQLHPQRVRSSQWCRCIDTAHAAFGQRIKVTPWSALNSFFQGQGDRLAQLNEARETASGISSGFEVWVTHQVVISALTDKNLAMGEFVVIKAQSNDLIEVLARGQVN
jgi:phosphohistidine phosphatase SixA